MNKLSARELRKQKLILHAQICRYQLQNELQQWNRPVDMARTLVGGAASWRFFTRLGSTLGHIHPRLASVGKLLRLAGVLWSVAKLLRSDK